VDAEKTARITILCKSGIKREAKKEILNRGIEKFAEGYLEIFELGLKEFKKKGGN